MQAMLGTLLRRRPDWAARVAASKRIAWTPARIADPALNEFLAVRPAAERDNIAPCAPPCARTPARCNPTKPRCWRWDTFRGNE
jgi:hypothetical protein